FAQALGAHDVILAYPTKLAGAPTVISRLVQRLAAVAGEEHWNGARARGTKYLAWARALDRPAEVKRIEKPAPKPPRAARHPSRPRRAPPRHGPPTAETGAAPRQRLMQTTFPSSGSPPPPPCRRPRPTAASSSPRRSAFSPRVLQGPPPPIRPARSSRSAP